MNRFLVIYQLHNQYHQLACATQLEAQQALQQVAHREDATPLGIYDAKTELFAWEVVRQQQYNQLSIEEQSRLDNQVITIAQSLHNQQRCQQ